MIKEPGIAYLNKTPNGSFADEIDLINNIHSTIEGHKENISQQFQKDNQSVEEYQERRKKKKRLQNWKYRRK